MDYYNGYERRKSVRINEALPVKFILFDSKNAENLLSNVINCSTQNISAGGFMVETDDLKNGQINDLINGMINIALEVKLPASIKPIKALAKVSWLVERKDISEGQKKFMMGLKFVDISMEDKDKIEKFVIEHFSKKLSENDKEANSDLIG